MAMCYAALEPSSELFRKYVQEMDKLVESGQITSRDHEILRLSPSAREELMELTLGDEHALTVSSIKSILANAKAAILAETEMHHQAKVQELSERGAAELTEAHERELSLTRRVSEAEAAANAATAAVAVLQQAATRKADKQVARARRIAHAATVTLITIVVAALLLGALLGSGLVSASQGASPTWKLVLSSFTVLAVLWGVYSWHTGKTVRQLGRDAENRLAAGIAALLGVDEQ